MIILYFISALICLVGWNWEYKRECRSMGKAAILSAIMISLVPGLNSVIALAFLSEIFVRWL